MTRRTFLRSTAMTAALASTLVAQPPDVATGLKIDRVEVFPAVYPMVAYFKFFSGAHGDGRPSVFLKLTCSDGTVGWGQAVPIPKWSYETLETSLIVLREYYAPALVGQSPLDIPALHARLDAEVAPGFSTGMPITRSAVDLALWDVAGKLRKKNVAELWGRKPGGSLTLSWTVNVRTLDEVEDVVAAGRARGYRHFNIKVAPDPAFDVALAGRVRKVAGDDCFLWADANTGFSPRAALDVAPKLAAAGVNVFEAPCKPNRLSAYRALVEQNALPILMDEGVVSPVELEEFIGLRMLHGVAMKPARCGGLTSNKAQIDLCLKHNLIWLGSGLTDPDVSLAATLILYAANGQARPCALNAPQFLSPQATALASPLDIKDGTATAPTGLGLGVDVDEERLRALAPKKV